MMNKARSMFRETVCFLLETEWGWIENVDDEVRENVVYVLMPINAVGARRPLHFFITLYPGEKFIL